MVWSKEDKDGPRGYHHGNLREALLRAALELIAQKGPGGFTFAEAARWAGSVRPRHTGTFATATSCWPALRCAAFISSRRRWRKPGMKAARTCSAHSIGWAKPISTSHAASPPTIGDVRGRHSTGDQSRASGGGRPGFRCIAGRGRKTLRTDAGAQSAAGVDGGVAIWAMAHGIASLFGRGDAARRTLPMSPEELLEAEVLVYLRGLGVAQPKPGAARTRPDQVESGRVARFFAA